MSVRTRTMQLMMPGRLVAAQARLTCDTGAAEAAVAVPAATASEAAATSVTRATRERAESGDNKLLPSGTGLNAPSVIGSTPTVLLSGPRTRVVSLAGY